jgi:hypothetical protein
MRSDSALHSVELRHILSAFVASFILVNIPGGLEVSSSGLLVPWFGGSRAKGWGSYQEP